MNRFIFILVCLLPIFSSAQEKLKTVNSEAEDFIVFLQKIPKEEQQYIKCFTSYAIPKDLRDDAVLQLSFMLHSLTGISEKTESAGAFYPIAIAEYDADKRKSVKYIQQISDTLYWVDIRNYNWSVESWEKITKFDGYIVEPIISNENNGILRLLSGNSLVRTDWFIYHAARTVSDTDRDKKNNPIYRELLYSLNKQPKTVPEFEKVWGLADKTKSRQIGNEYGTLVTKSKNVARHNRFLFGYRTELGWYYRSYDVKHQQGKRDYVERFYEFGGAPPDIFDGGEIFGTNQLQLQVYDLYDDKENLADAADATIVRHLSDILGDARITVVHSCFDCHAEGPIPSENTITEFLKKNGAIYYKNKADQLRVERAFLSDKFEESVKENQELYEKAVKKSNGLLPKDNVQAYYNIIMWYDKPVTMEQAAIECGITVEEFIQKSQDGLQKYNNKIPGRLALLLSTKEPIPREIWEAPNIDGIPGIFQQSMIILNGLTEVITEIEYVAYINEECNFSIQGNLNQTQKLSKNTKLVKIGNLDQTGQFTSVTLEDGKVGWVTTKYITKGKL